MEIDYKVLAEKAKTDPDYKWIIFGRFVEAMPTSDHLIDWADNLNLGFPSTLALKNLLRDIAASESEEDFRQIFEPND